ncbi:MAG: glycerol-3-phosphate dehydrogenase [Candidatus Altiarchaeales archaeon HGW-Altiarchaeales-2]|nr:MAG: glycerol-3-phosphate dehydrogenase [Candidatus Altiarchaeales archaeon HGW-Altiarchaeales-2]
MTKISILGAGAMGTALAELISKNADEVYLYARRKEVYDNLKKLKINVDYFPSIKLPNNIIPINDLEQINNSECIFLTVPSHAIREIITKSKGFISEDTIIVNTAKGIEYPPLKRMSEVIAEELKGENIVTMSGPNFAHEIINNNFSSTTIAAYSNSTRCLKKVKKIIETDNFIVENSYDLVGVELCGVLKNINAIAIGICEAFGLNENAQYFLFTKGVNEMRDILLSFGGNPETLFCYCGFGDLCLTSHSDKSRNRTLGLLCGQHMYDNQQTKGITYEGKRSVLAIREFCHKKGIECEVIDFVYDVIHNKREPKTSFYNLWKNIKNKNIL